ncbi:MAG: response regulator [Methanothrix sp.]|nr:response regulator [Methanothrix sp.]
MAFLNPDKETQQIMAIQAGIDPAHILSFPVKVSELEGSVYKGKRIRYEKKVEIGWIREPGNPPVFLENIALSPIFAQGEVVGLLALANRVDGFKTSGTTFFKTFSLLIATACKIFRKWEEFSAPRDHTEETERLSGSKNAVQLHTPVFLADLIKEVVDALPQATMESVPVRYDIHQDLPDGLEGDADLIKRILVLILTAMNNHRTKEEIVVSAYPSHSDDIEDPNACWIDIVVQEREGEVRVQGLPNTEERGQEATLESEKGKYLLAKEVHKAQKMVKQAGGKVELQVEKGLGIIVTLKLPFGLSKRSPVGKNLSETTHESELSGLTILVAEDDPINRRIVKTLLERRGCLVIEVEDGEQAINLWRVRLLDLILMDIRMPKVDGYEATKMIREEEKTRGAGTVTPIVALTAYAMQEDREKCIAMGMDEHVSKPIQKEELIAKILRLTGRSEA